MSSRPVSLVRADASAADSSLATAPGEDRAIHLLAAAPGDYLTIHLLAAAPGEDRAIQLDLPALLARVAAGAGDRDALRYKERGLWHVWTWRRLAGAVDAVARALAGLGVEPGHAVLLIGGVRCRAIVAGLAAQACGAHLILADVGADLAPLQEAADRSRLGAVLAEDREAAERIAHALEGGSPLPPVVLLGSDAVDSGWSSLDRILASSRTVHAAARTASAPARTASAPAPTGRAELLAELAGTDVAAVVAPDSWRANAPELLVDWLAAGFALALPEQAASASADLSAIAPTYLVADARWYRDLWWDTQARLPVAGSWRRRLIDWALAARRPGRTGRLGWWGDRVGRWLVRAPLRRVLGLGRVRVARFVGGPLDPGARAFFASLGLEPILHGAAARAGEKSS